MIELVFILDKSGSMQGLEKDTIGGFNSMIERQKKEEGEALVSTILFNEESKAIHDRVSIKDVPKLTEKEYYVEGCTALLDAVGGAIKHIGNIHKYARKEDVPDKTLFVITTDGMENASRRYGYKEVKRLITNQREKYGWEFIFLGANIDAEGEGEKFGIKREMGGKLSQRRKRHRTKLQSHRRCHKLCKKKQRKSRQTLERRNHRRLQKQKRQKIKTIKEKLC